MKNSRVAVALTIGLSFWLTAQAVEIGSPAIQEGEPFSRPPVQSRAALIFLTHNLDPDTVTFDSPGCNSGGVTTDNQYYRVFDLDGDHGLEGLVCASQVEFGVGFAEGGPQQLEVIVACLSEPISDAALEAGLVDSSVVSQQDADNILATVDVGGCCDAQTSDMAIGVRSEDCLETGTCSAFFIGSNFQGQTASAYLSAPDCGIAEPIDTCAVTFCDDQIVINAYVTGEPADEVPAAAMPGLFAMILLLLVGSGIARYLPMRAEDGIVSIRGRFPDAGKKVLQIRRG